MSYYLNEKHFSLNEAVEKAVDECIAEGILVDFFRKNKAVVKKMSIYEFDQKGYMQVVREESREEGLKEGRKEGSDLRDAQLIEDMLRRGKSVEEIVDFCRYPMELVRKIEEKVLEKV